MSTSTDLVPRAPALPATSAGVDLLCHAPARPSAIIARQGKPCGAMLQRNAPPATYEFVTIARRMPATADGNSWLRCATCKTWNSFKVIVAPITLVQTTLDEVIDGYLQRLPERQQIAAIMLGQGFNNSQAAREVGVDPKTIGRWAKVDEFVVAQDAIAAKHRASTEQTGYQHSRIAMQALMDVIESDRARGVAHNARWFLSRTVFRDLELMKAQAGASGTNVSVSVAQSQSQTQGSIQSIWEKRRASLDVTPMAQPD